MLQKTELATALFLFSSPCAQAPVPAMVCIIDQALTTRKVQNVEKVKALRSKGMALIGSGNHEESRIVLAKAIELAGLTTPTMAEIEHRD